MGLVGFVFIVTLRLEISYFFNYHPHFLVKFLGAVVQTLHLYNVLIVLIFIILFHWYFCNWFHLILVLDIQPSVKNICTDFFRVLQETCVHKNPIKHILSEKNNKDYLRVYHQVVSTLYFIHFLQFILLPRYFRQLPFSPPPPPEHVPPPPFLAQAGMTSKYISKIVIKRITPKSFSRVPSWPSWYNSVTLHLRATRIKAW